MRSQGRTMEIMLIKKEEMMESECHLVIFQLKVLIYLTNKAKVVIMRLKTILMNEKVLLLRVELLMKATRMIVKPIHMIKLW